jgi:hypothetical protein
MADKRFDDEHAVAEPHTGEDTQGDDELTLSAYDSDILETDEGVSAEDVHGRNRS